jgi:Fe-S-cluster containining protein
MPHGKPAGVRCVHLTDNNLCALFGKPERPDVCRLFQPSLDVCGHSRQEAFILLTLLEEATRPEHV